MRTRLIDENPTVAPVYAELQQTVGRITNLFRTLANRPEILAAFWPLYQSVMFKGLVSRRLKEKLALKVSGLNRCQYCIRSHSATLERLGVPRTDLDALETLTGMPPDEEAALRYAVAVTQQADAVADDMFQRLQAHFTPEQIVEITAVVGLFNFINRFVDALQVPS